MPTSTQDRNDIDRENAVFCVDTVHLGTGPAVVAQYRRLTLKGVMLASLSHILRPWAKCGIILQPCHLGDCHMSKRSRD